MDQLTRGDDDNGAASGGAVVFANPLVDTMANWRNRAVSDVLATVVPQTDAERLRVASVFFGDDSEKKNQRDQFVARLRVLHSIIGPADNGELPVGSKSQKEYPFSPVVEVPAMNRAPIIAIYGDGVVRLTTEQPSDFQGDGLDSDQLHDLWAYGMFDASAPGRDIEVSWRFEPSEGKTPRVLPRIRIQTSSRHETTIGRINLSRLVRMHGSQMYFNYRKRRNELDRDPADTCRRLITMPVDPQDKMTIADELRARRKEVWFREFNANDMPTQAEHDAGMFRRATRAHAAPVYGDKIDEKITVSRPARLNATLWWTIVLNDRVSLVLDIRDVRPEATGNPTGREVSMKHTDKAPYVNYTSNLQLIARHDTSVSCLSRVALANFFVNLYDNAHVDMGGNLVTDTLRLFMFNRTCRFHKVRVVYMAYGAIPPDCGEDAVELLRMTRSHGDRVMRYAMMIVSARLSANDALSSCASRIRTRADDDADDDDVDAVSRRRRLGADIECGGNYPECHLEILHATTAHALPNDNSGVQNRVRQFWEVMLDGTVDAVVPFFDQLLRDKERMLFPIDDDDVRKRIARPPFKGGPDRKGVQTSGRFNPYHKWLVIKSTVSGGGYLYVRIGSPAWTDFVNEGNRYIDDEFFIDGDIYASLVQRNAASGINNGAIRFITSIGDADADREERSAFVPPGRPYK